MALFEQFWWLEPLVRSAVTLAASYLVGKIFCSVVATRLTRFASESRGPWDDVLTRELQSRVPLWAFLIGLWVSIGYWPLAERWARLGSSAISVVGFASVTFAVASIATQLVGVYGPRAVPGIHVSGLTKNVVRLLVIAAGLLVMLNEMG